MIIDHLSNAANYFGFNEYFDMSISWLLEHQEELAEMENGEYEIDGRNAYAIVNSYDTKPATECGWEAHKVYCDIHYSVSGNERIGYQHISQMTESQAYNSEKDFALFKGEGDFLAVREGMFFFVAPEDVHAPSANLVEGQSAFLKKVVIKLKF